jgi:DNA-directed RNA polymerase subunit F
MTQTNVIEEKPISIYELKEELEKNKKKFTQLNFRAAKTDEHIDQFIQIKPKEGKELIKKLTELNIPRLRDVHIYKIADVMPHKIELVKLLFQGSPITISDDNCKKIVKVVEEYLPKKKPSDEKTEEKEE